MFFTLADLHPDILWLQQSILDMEVSELLADGSNEARSSVDELDDHGPSGTVTESDHRISSQGHSQSDAAKPDERESVPDCSNVPSSSCDVSDAQTSVHQTNVDTVPITADPDIFLYLALGTAILVMVSAVYKQVAKK